MNLTFTCSGTQLPSLAWFKDGGTTPIAAYSFDGSQTVIPPEEFTVNLTSYQRIPVVFLANFTATLVVSNITAVDGSEFCCGLGLNEPSTQCKMIFIVGEYTY